MSRPVEASAARVKRSAQYRAAQCRSGTASRCAYGFCRQLRLHHIAGTFFQQFRQRIPSTISSGSITLPLDLDIFWLRHHESGRSCKRCGTAPAVCIFIFDEVHGHHDHAGNPEEVMSKPDTITLVGWNWRSASVFPASRAWRRSTARRRTRCRDVFILTQRNISTEVIFFTHFASLRPT